MNRMILAAACMSPMSIAPQAYAQEPQITEGAGFHALCISRRNDTFYGPYCSGVVVGISTKATPTTATTFDDHANKRGAAYCFPNRTTNGQIYDVLTNYIQREPRYRHLTLSDLFTLAMNEAFPCPQGSRPIVSTYGFVYLEPPPKQP